MESYFAMLNTITILLYKMSKKIMNEISKINWKMIYPDEI